MSLPAYCFQAWVLHSCEYYVIDLFRSILLVVPVAATVRVPASWVNIIPDPGWSPPHPAHPTRPRPTPVSSPVRGRVSGDTALRTAVTVSPRGGRPETSLLRCCYGIFTLNTTKTHQKKWVICRRTLEISLESRNPGPALPTQISTQPELRSAPRRPVCSSDTR